MKKHPLKRSDIRDQRIGDELYLTAADGETLTVLNAAAQLIWSLCDGTHSEDDIVKALHRNYPDMDQDTLREDLTTCLAGFRQKKLMD